MSVGDRFAFAYALTPDDQRVSSPVEGGLSKRAGGFAEFMHRFAGCTFDDGLYRVHDRASGLLATELLAIGFPQHVERVLPFAYDWMGSQFCLDADRDQDGEPLVLVLEIGTGETLRVPTSFAQFQDEELVEEADAAVSRSFFERWKEAAGSDALPLRRNQCVGYRVPLFLSGEDDIENLEVIDIDVYWSLTGQALSQTR